MPEGRLPQLQEVPRMSPPRLCDSGASLGPVEAPVLAPPASHRVPVSGTSPAFGRRSFLNVFFNIFGSF